MLPFHDLAAETLRNFYQRNYPYPGLEQELYMIVEVTVIICTNLFVINYFPRDTLYHCKTSLQALPGFASSLLLQVESRQPLQNASCV